MKTSASLGLAVSALSLEYGQSRTFDEMRCFIDAAAEVCPEIEKPMSWQRIWQIEQRALRKLRNRYLFMKDEGMKEAVESLMKR